MSQLIGDNRLDPSVDDLVLMLSSQEAAASNRRPQVTRSIVVPTSEHVAQIVGKSGSKIKNLRASTNTCIKTPLRGDEPVFTISGTEANVEKVITAISEASNWFTKLKEDRAPACAIGEVTILVPVPQQYVGVVVGRNGSVIMRIKDQTRTRINTPKGDAESPSFEVTGNQINVMAAKEAIEDKVRQALMLKDSTAYDPDLTHKTKSLAEAVEWPSIRQHISGSSPSTSSLYNSEANHNTNNRPIIPSLGWPSSGARVEKRTPSLGLNSLDINTTLMNFGALSLSPPFMTPDMNSGGISFRF